LLAALLDGFMLQLSCQQISLHRRSLHFALLNRHECCFKCRLCQHSYLLVNQTVCLACSVEAIVQRARHQNPLKSKQQFLLSVHPLCLTRFLLKTPLITWPFLLSTYSNSGFCHWSTGKHSTPRVRSVPKGIHFSAVTVHL
jgi:hypothetical protein